MTGAATEAPEPDGAADRGPHRPGAGWGSVVVGAVAVMALRLELSLDARFPRVVADEPAYLAMARLLGGGERWDMGLASTYGVGYSVLLAPWFALDLSPTAAYRAAILTNVVLGGLTFFALEALARRLPGVRRPLSVGLAVVAASLPALVATTNLAWSDDLAPLTFVVLVLAVAALVERPDARRVAALVAVTALGYSVHGRFLPLAPIAVAVPVVLALGRRLPARLALAAVVGTGAGLGLVQLASEAVYDRLYDPMAVTQGLDQADRITHVKPFVASALGQGWTLLVTTAGLAGLGVIALVLAARDGWRGPEGDEPPRRAARLARPAGPDGALPPLVTGTVLAFVGMGFLVSVVFMTDRPRGDHLVYGRYNDLFVAPLVLAGAAFLVTARSRARLAVSALAVAIATVAPALVLWRARREVLEGGHLVFPVLGLVAVDHAGPAALPRITVVGVVLLAVLAGLALLVPHRARATAVLVVAAVLCVAGSVRAVDRIDPSRDADPSDAATIAATLEPGERLVWVADDDANPISRPFYRAQLYLPDNRSVRAVAAPDNPVVQERGAPWDRGEPFVVAGADRAEPAAAGYRLAWVDAGSTVGLWVAPGDRQDRLAATGDLVPAPGPDGEAAPDEGTVRFAADPTTRGGEVRGRVGVDRPGGVPWATTAPGGPTGGRVRVRIRVEGQRCGCTLADGRADIGRWVPADETTLTVPFAVAVEVPADEDAVVTAELLREGGATFGDLASAPLR